MVVLAFGGMTDYHQPSLMSAMIITGGWIHLEHTDTGWSVTVTHRHEGGQHNDCETFQQEGLEWAEVLEVLDCIMMTVGCNNAQA